MDILCKGQKAYSKKNKLKKQHQCNNKPAAEYIFGYLYFELVFSVSHKQPLLLE